jgi:hypothetical protein
MFPTLNDKITVTDSSNLCSVVLFIPKFAHDVDRASKLITVFLTTFPTAVWRRAAIFPTIQPPT